MDFNSNENIAHYTSIDELPMHNWIRIRKGEEDNLSWLLMDYRGFPKEPKLPKGIEKVWQSIKEEYEELTRDSEAEDYYELKQDISDANTRIIMVSGLLGQIAKGLSDDTLKKFIEELKGWRVFFNSSNDRIKELKKCHAQLRAMQMKLNQQEKKADRIEKGLEKQGVPVRKLKARVENIIKRNIDFRIMTVSEWFFTLNDLSKHKKSA